MTMSDKTILDEIRQEGRLRHGRAPTAREYAREFSLFNLNSRVALMKRLEDETPKAMSPEEASDYHAYAREMKRVHEALRKVNR